MMSCRPPLIFTGTTVPLVLKKSSAVKCNIIKNTISLSAIRLTKKMIQFLILTKIFLIKEFANGKNREYQYIKQRFQNGTKRQ